MPFCPKNEEKYTERWSKCKKDAKRDAKSSFCCSEGSNHEGGRKYCLFQYLIRSDVVVIGDAEEGALRFNTSTSF